MAANVTEVKPEKSSDSAPLPETVERPEPDFDSGWEDPEFSEPTKGEPNAASTASPANGAGFYTETEEEAIAGEKPAEAKAEPEKEPAGVGAATVADAKIEKPEKGVTASPTEPDTPTGKTGPPTDKSPGTEANAPDPIEKLRTEFLSYKSDSAKRENNLKADIGRLRKSAREAVPEKKAPVQAPELDVVLKPVQDMEPEVASALKQMYQRQEAHITELQDQVNSVTRLANSQSEQVHTQFASQRVEAAHQEWEKTAQSVEFAAWKETQPALIRRVIDESDDPDEVIQVLDLFKSAATSPPETFETESSEPEKKTEQALAPTQTEQSRQARRKSSTSVPTRSAAREPEKLKTNSGTFDDGWEEGGRENGE